MPILWVLFIGFSLLFFLPRPFLLEFQNVNDRIDFSNEIDTYVGQIDPNSRIHAVYETKSTNHQNDTGCFGASQTFFLFNKKIE